MLYIESINKSLHQIMESNQNAFIIGEDVLDPYGGAFGVVKGLSTKYPERVKTTPICEASITGLSVGMALRGMIPIAEIMFGDFITLTIDQLVNHMSKFLFMYGKRMELPFILRTPMGGGRGYGPTHSQSLEKLLLSIQGVTLINPGIFHNPGELLSNAVERKSPVVFLENKVLYPEKLFLEDNSGLFIKHFNEVGKEFNIAVVKNYEDNDPDISVISYGGASKVLKNVMIKLIDEEIRIQAIFVSNLSPMKNSLVKKVKELIFSSKPCLIVEDSSIDFGWGAEMISRLYGINKIDRIGSCDTVIPASKKLESSVLINEEKIINKIIELIK